MRIPIASVIIALIAASLLAPASRADAAVEVVATIQVGGHRPRSGQQQGARLQHRAAKPGLP